MTTARCRVQHPRSNYEPGARIVECDLPAGHTGYHVEAGGGVSWPPAPPATAMPSCVEAELVSTEPTAEQKIRADALHEAVTFGHLFECPEDDPIDFALTAAKRFEAYIRDGAA